MKTKPILAAALACALALGTTAHAQEGEPTPDEYYASVNPFPHPLFELSTAQSATKAGYPVVTPSHASAA